MDSDKGFQDQMDFVRVRLEKFKKLSIISDDVKQALRQFESDISQPDITHEKVREKWIPVLLKVLDRLIIMDPEQQRLTLDGFYSTLPVAVENIPIYKYVPKGATPFQIAILTLHYYGFDFDKLIMDIETHDTEHRFI